MERRAKIVATIGPNSSDEKMLQALIEAGMDVARLNFSHGSHEQHAERIALIRKLSQKNKKPITILQDLQGPKLRVGTLPDEGIELITDTEISLSTTSPFTINGKHITIPVDFPNLAHSVKKGQTILLDDGNLELCVTSTGEEVVDAKVILGGTLTSHKGVNVPGVHLDIPGFTDKDRSDLAFGLENDIDVVAISFVCSSADVEAVREAIRQINPNKTHIPIIAKLERPEALENLEQIVQCADGVMVARGDLAVETSPALVPIMQKRIIETANRFDKVVITATQMLDSMIHNPRPTRAEASDVANAIFDGTDAVMLSAETASGKYPVKSITTMDAIIREAEKNYSNWGHCKVIGEADSEDPVSLTRAARELAHDRNVASIAVFTRTGRTALLMAKTRPDVPILAFTPDIHTYQLMGLYWGISPYIVPHASTVESMLSYVEAALMTHTSMTPNQQTVIISGYPVGTFRDANLILLHTLGKPA